MASAAALGELKAPCGIHEHERRPVQLCRHAFTCACSLQLLQACQQLFVPLLQLRLQQALKCVLHC